MYDDEEALQAEGVGHFSNLIINKGPEVENQCLPQSGVAPYSPTNRLFIYRLMNGAGRPT